MSPQPREVARAGEIYLASLDRTTGAVVRSGRFRLVEGSRPQVGLTGLFPPAIAIGEQGRDIQPYASTITFEDLRGGIGVLYHDPERHARRVWWSTSDLRYPGQQTLPKRKTNRANPSATKKARYGIVYGDRVYVAFDDTIYRYQEGSGWSAALHAFSGSTLAAGEPFTWGTHLFWPLGATGITYGDGTTWVNAVKSCVGAVVYGDILYTIGADGWVRKTSTKPAGLLAADATTWAGTFSDVVRIDDTCSALVLFPNPDGDMVPYVVGKRRLYALDVFGTGATNVAVPAGPELPPHRATLRTAVLGADGAAYLAQGMGVVRWDGELAQPVGLDRDHGVPAAYRGQITRLLNGGQSLFALVDATSVAGAADPDLYGGAPVGEDGMVAEGAGLAGLFSREEEGWVVRAVSTQAGTAATCLFLSTAENTYRVWFAWDSTLYSIDLEEGLFNPLDTPGGDYEATSETIYPHVDYGYKEHGKVALLAQWRTKRCSASETVKPSIQFDEDGAWWPLYNADGSWGIVSDGRHDFLIHADLVPPHADVPATGRAHDRAQIKHELARGADSSLTPAVVWAGLHVVKGLPPLTGWRVTLDLGAEYDGRTPWQQHVLLRQLIADNASGLLHLSLGADDGSATARVYAVKITEVGGLEETGLAPDYRGRVRLALTEVVA